MSKGIVCKPGKSSGKGQLDATNSFPIEQAGCMPIIRCTCGYEILLVPDISGMNRAIENHINLHNKIALSSGKKRVSPDKVRQILVEKILLKASKSSLA